MAPTTRAAKQAALADQKRETQPPVSSTRGVAPHIPPNHPKFIAKKYLEDPKMTQIHSDSKTTEVEDLTCLMGSKLIFSHYDPSDKARAVFK
jgi:hypothetical protein